MKHLSFFLLVVALNAKGQNTIGLPQIINYSKADFHAGAQTWDIEQDDNGVMYFANNEGLVTFDGSYWKVYPLPNRTIMRSLAMGDKGRIYVGGQSEMGYFEPDENGFLKYVSLTKLVPADQNKFADIWDIEVLGESVFFRATDRIFELRNNNIRVFLPPGEWQFLKKAGNLVYAQDKINGLMFYRMGEWLPVPGSEELRDELVSGIIETGPDSFLVTTIKNKLFLSHNGSFVSKIIPEGSNLPNNDVYKSARVNEKEFVAATTSEGCLVMNFDGKIVQKISKTEGLQNNNVLCVFLDKDKNLWTGLNNGISFIAYNSAIKYIQPSKSDELSGFSSRIYQNKLYIASSNGLFAAPISFDKKDISFEKSDFSLIKNSSGIAWKLQEVNQQLLMGHNGGTFYIQNQEAIPVSKEASWIFVPTSPIVPAKTILAGTYTGLKLIAYNDHTFSDLGDPKGIYESLRFLTIDNAGVIWASHPYRGIFKIHLAPDHKTFQAELLTDKDGLPSELDNHVFKIKNRVVFATKQGVYEYDDASKRFIKSAFLDPVFGNLEIRYLTEASDGSIWFCSGKKIGVVHFNKTGTGKAFRITYFPELTAQILSGFENIYPYDNQNIFIGSEKGMIHLNYDNYITHKANINVLMGQVRAFGKSDTAIFGGYTNPTQTTEKEKAAITKLPKSYNSIHFEYSSTDFDLQKNIEYSYFLEGYDKNWSSWSAKTEKDYTNLPAGDYSFKIKAHDNLGNESAPVAYRFKVNPAWYETIWAWLLYLLLFGLVMYYLNILHKKKLRAQKLKFEEEQRKLKYIHQLEIEKSEKEIIQLQNEKLENEIIYKTRELASANIHLVERSDALLKVKDELQKIFKKSSDNHDVKKTLLLLDSVEKNDANWENFATHFDEVNDDFLKKLKSKFPVLSNNDLKICAYIQLNLASKEIAQLMNLSLRGVEVSRYRLRKKMQIPTETSLKDFLNAV